MVEGKSGFAGCAFRGAVNGAIRSRFPKAILACTAICYEIKVHVWIVVVEGLKAGLHNVSVILVRRNTRTDASSSGPVDCPPSVARCALCSTIQATTGPGLGDAIIARADIHCKMSENAHGRLVHSRFVFFGCRARTFAF